MGREANCEARFGDKVSAGRALLETDRLIFRGGFRISIPLSTIESVEAAGGVLHVESPAGTAQFALGTAAEKWARKIRNPPSRPDKLEIKPGLSVAILGLDYPAFREEIQARAASVSDSTPAKPYDLVFLGADTPEHLAKLPSLLAALKRNGGIWVVYPKGRKDITERDVRRAGLSAGLVDIKVARFSDTRTALKFVIPVARR